MLGMEKMLADMLGVDIEEVKAQAIKAATDAQAIMAHMMKTQQDTVNVVVQLHAQNVRIEDKLDQLAKALNFEFIVSSKESLHAESIHRIEHTS